MTPEAIPGYAWLLVKILTIVGIGLYTIFAGLMVRQEQLMANVLEEQFEPILRMLTLIHLAAAGFVFFLSFFLL